MYTFSSTVRFSETDKDNKLSISQLISYFQDCSNFHSNSIGLYKDILLGLHRAWFLTSWQIVINRRPRIDEKIEVETRAYDIKGFYGLRNFIIYDENKEVCAYANSVWFYVDTNKGKPVKYEQAEGTGFEIDEEFPMEKADRKITIPSSASREIKGDSFKVRESHLDSNIHMNNREYVRMALDFLPERFDVDEIKQIRVEYKKAAVLDEVVLTTYYYDDGGKKVYASLDSEDGETFAKVEFELR